MVKTRGWTKWGGGRLMLIKSNPDIWYCQACGQEQTKESPAYMFPIGGENYIKICTQCEHKVLHIRIYSFERLQDIIRPSMWVDNNGKG